MREQGDGVIDALIEYLVGDVDELTYTVDLTERKSVTTFELQVLAHQKLKTVLGDIPACETPADALRAAQDPAAGRLPRCLAGGIEVIDIAIRTFGPIMDGQVASFVDTQVPAQLSYSLADFESQVGGGLETVRDLRRRVIEGVSFTEQDLIDALADENDPASRADAETLLQVLADGVLITEKNIVDNLEPDALWQLDDARGYAKARAVVTLAPVGPCAAPAHWHWLHRQ